MASSRVYAWLRGPPDKRSVFGLSPKIVAIGIFLLALFLRIGYWRMVGTITGGSSQNFLIFCDGLLTDPGSLLSTMADATGVGTVSYWLLYSGYWVPLCGVLQLPGGSLNAIVGIQIVLSSLACVLIFQTGVREVGPIGGAVAGITMALFMDSFVWATRILTDAPFVFVLSLTLWQISRYKNDQTGRNRALVWACFILLTITRPNGLALVIGWLVFDLLPRDHSFRFNIFPYRRFAVSATIVAVPILLFVIIPGALTFVQRHWSSGVIVANDPTFRYQYVPRPSSSPAEFVLMNLDYLLVMAVLKVLVFFLPVVGRFSLLHNVINLFTLVPAIVLGFVGAYRLISRRSTLARDWVVPLLVVVIIISATHIDYSWGYRAPLTPLLCLLTGYTIGTSPRLAALTERLSLPIDGFTLNGPPSDTAQSKP